MFIVLLSTDNIYFKLFFLWAGYRTLFQYNKEALIVFNTIFVYIMFYQFIKNKVKKENIPTILNSICIVSLFNVFLILLKASHFLIEGCPLNNVLFIKTNLLSGIMGNINISSALLAVSLPLFFRKGWRWGIAIIWLGLIIMRCLGGIIPSALITIYFLCRGRRAIYKLLIAGLSSIPLFYFIRTDIIQSLVESSRLNVWKIIILRVIPVNWAQGMGLGQFKQLFPIMHRTLDKHYSALDFLHCHNEYFNLITELGVIPIFIIVGLMFYLKSIRVNTTISIVLFMGLCAFFMNAFVNFPIYTIVGMLFVLYIALLEVEYNA